MLLHCLILQVSWQAPELVLILHTFLTSALFIGMYTEQNYKCNTFVFASIFHELNFFYVHKTPISLQYCSQICLNLLVSTSLPR